jgi:hypothetical protein
MVDNVFGLAHCTYDYQCSIIILDLDEEEIPSFNFILYLDDPYILVPHDHRLIDKTKAYSIKTTPSCNNMYTRR